MKRMENSVKADSLLGCAALLNSQLTDCGLKFEAGTGSLQLTLPVRSSYLLLETVRLFVTENDPETPLARRLTRSLSPSLSTIPSRVTCPFFTMIRIGL